MNLNKREKIMAVMLFVSILLLIGVSYAYFTANVSIVNEENKTTTVHTVEFASATMDLGEKVSASNVLPGYKEIKTVTVVGDGKENTRSITANIVLSPNVVDFSNHVKYYLYEVEGIRPVDPTTICENSNPINESNAYYDAMKCNTTNLGEPVASGTFNKTTVVEHEIEVTSTMKKTYYLLIEYINDETASQDTEQGKGFTVTIGFTAGDNILEYKESILNGADPVLKEGLIPIKIDNTGKVTKANTETEWYNYEKKEWANAIKTVSNKEYALEEEIPESDIESYFVWIPRYKYKVFSNESYSSLTSVTESKVEEIDIIFESKEVIPSTDTTKGSYLTHPAFVTMNTNGLWVGKFETGYKGATSTTGNYSGIYDMSGGAWEYVMGVMLDQNLSPLSGRSATYNSGFKGIYSEGGSNTTGQNFPVSKYYDTYLYGTNDKDFSRFIYGDATGELGLTNSDKNSFVELKYPWLVRGSTFGSSALDNIFSFNRDHGAALNIQSFRIVLAI